MKGVIVGEILAIILLLISIRVSWWEMLLFLVPMGIDWFLQYIDILSSTNIRRFITDLLGGIGLTYFYFIIIESIIKLFWLTNKRKGSSNYGKHDDDKK